MPEQNKAFPPPDYFQQLLEGFNKVTNEVGKYREEQRAGFQRLEEQRAEDNRRYEEDQRRFYGPMYSYMAHQGQFHTMAQPPPPPLGMTPLNGVILEDLAPGVEVLMAGMTVAILTWATGAMEAALEAVTMAEKAGTRDSA
ncbi:unnamed protein product [Cuscuta epithymum]|uniref:Uncharacterized protein n=1 Tax=Cuscuta epithymum TaxID=186058 RepID=A0AAV0DX43_9ASTE|nr:unnamed protein product [Cuscuta epithymum]